MFLDVSTCRGGDGGRIAADDSSDAGCDAVGGAVLGNRGLSQALAGGFEAIIAARLASASNTAPLFPVIPWNAGATVTDPVGKGVGTM